MEEDEETPQLMRTKSDAACVIQRRPRCRAPGEAQRIDPATSVLYQRALLQPQGDVPARPLRPQGTAPSTGVTTGPSVGRAPWRSRQNSPSPWPCVQMWSCPCPSGGTGSGGELPRPKSHQNIIPLHGPKACIFSITHSLSIHSQKLHGYLESDAKFTFNQVIF